MRIDIKSRSFSNPKLQNSKTINFKLRCQQYEILPALQFGQRWVIWASKCDAHLHCRRHIHRASCFLQRFSSFRCGIPWGTHTCHASHHRLPQNLQLLCGGHRLRVRRALGRTLVTVGLSLWFVSYEKKLRKIHTCGDQCSPSQRQARKFWVSNFSASTNTTLRFNPPGGGEFPGTGVVEV